MGAWKIITAPLFISTLPVLPQQLKATPQATLVAPLNTASLSKSDWRLVHDADLILKVRISYPGEPAPQNPGYWTVKWEVLATIKGDFRNPESPGAIPKIAVAFYRGQGADSTPLNLLRKLSGQIALVFLTSGDKGNDSATYICQFHEAIQRYDSSVAVAIKAEIQNQEEMAISVQRALDARLQPLEPEVLALIQSLQSPATYQHTERMEAPDTAEKGAFTFPRPIDGLQKLGITAIPAIIKHLDDRRPLPLGRTPIELDTRDQPGTFEGIYHTSASEMVDVLSFSLEGLTQTSFGRSTNSTGSRDKEILGWRLYLGHDPIFRTAVMNRTSPQ